MSDTLSDLTAHCIRCGFCLESCPTFVVTGKETESPRGRIYLIRSADAGVMPWNDASVKEHIDTCVGCRACETACPSGVEYGAILEMAREKLENEHRSFGKKMLLGGITSPGKLRMQLALGKLLPGRKMPKLLSRTITREEPQAERPAAQEPAHWPALDESIPLKGEVAILQGCAMSVLFPRVNEATKRLLRRVGYQAVPVEGCCGALHAHNGYLSEARQMAAKVLDKAGDKPFIVNSAGCGSFLKEQDRGKVMDISEFLLANGLPELLAKTSVKQKITYHDACHLAHGQKITAAPRELIKAIPSLQYTELKEADMCCGSGGIYNVTEPTLARKLLERKWQNVVDTGAEIVVTGNPGCHAWIEQRAREAGASVKVMHTAEFLETAIMSNT